MHDFTLYDRSNIHQLSWNYGHQYEKDYILPLIASGPQAFIDNVETQMHVFQAGNLLFPMTLNTEEYESAYVCSPYTGYVSYGKQELWKLHNKCLEAPLAALLTAISPLLKAGEINKIACVNNWLLSTNLYPDWDGRNVKEITEFLISAFPNHTIMFRSLNKYTNEILMEQFLKNGYLLIPSREIFIFDSKLKRFRNKRNTVNDFKLLEKTPYKIVSHEEISAEDYPRIAELYYLLYFGKYSNCSPLFNENFVRLCHQKRLLNFQGARDRRGVLAGIVGSYVRNRVLTTPFVGHDTNLPLEDGLFRMITALAVKEALEKQCIFNISAGASQFKRRRGAVGFIEYSAIYQRHLPLKRNIIWNTLHLLMSKIGVPLLQKYHF